jgi:PAS domain S-box-containing protein
MATTVRHSTGDLPDANQKSSCGIGLVAITTEGVVVRWNPAAEKVLGYAAGEIVGRSVTTLLPPARAREMRDLVERIQITQSVETLKGELRSKDGRTCEQSLTVSPLWWDAEGRVTGLAFATEDPSPRGERQATVHRLAHCFEHVGAAVAIVNEGTATYDLVNPAYARLHGYTPQELKGRPFRDVVPPEIHSRLEEEMRRTGLSGHSILEFTHVHRDGTRFPVLVDATAVKDDDGKPLYRVVTVHDLSDVRRLEEHARLYRTAVEEAHWLEAVFACAVDGLLIVEPSGRVVLANDRAARIFGVAKEELLVPISDYPERYQLQSADGNRNPVPLALRALAGETVEPVERRITGGDGTERYLRAGAAPIRDGSGRITGAVVVIGDVTEEKRSQAKVLELNRTLEARVRERTRELQEALDELGAFAYTVAHDLRAPLRALHAYSDILAEDYRGRPLDAEGYAHLDRIREAARRMDALIHGILDYSRLGRAEHPTEPVELGDAVAAVLKELWHQVETAGASVDVKAPLPRVRANRLLVRQVLGNLLSNGLKFVAPGVKPRVELWAERIGDRVRIFVKDNGIGIAEDYHARVFGVFERLNSTEEYPGTGIGLAIVRRALERLGGKVGLESAPGQGSTFWIELRAEDDATSPGSEA